VEVLILFLFVGAIVGAACVETCVRTNGLNVDALCAANGVSICIVNVCANRGLLGGTLDVEIGSAISGTNGFSTCVENDGPNVDANDVVIAVVAGVAAGVVNGRLTRALPLPTPSLKVKSTGCLSSK